MPGLLEEWTSELQKGLERIPVDDASVAVVTIAILSMLIAAFGRHRQTVRETAVLAAVALLLVRFSELPSIVIAAGAIVNATRGGSRRKRGIQLQALDRQIASNSEIVQGFLAALDRRTREIDLRGQELEDITLKRTLDAVSGLARSHTRGNGEAPDPTIS